MTNLGELKTQKQHRVRSAKCDRKNGNKKYNLQM